MLELTDVFLLIIIGSIGGFLSGMLGVGGGVIFVPVIDFILSSAGVNEDIAVNIILANSIATIAFTGTISSIKQVRMGNFLSQTNSLHGSAWCNYFTRVIVRHFTNSFLFKR